MIALALSPIARWAVGALIILGVLGGIYAKGRIDGRQTCEDRVRAAVSAEQTRQRAVQEAVADKWQAIITVNDRAAMERQKDKDLGYEEALHDPDARQCGMSASGVRRHNRITGARP